jgi:hypothetical protein
VVPSGCGVRSGARSGGCASSWRRDGSGVGVHRWRLVDYTVAAVSARNAVRRRRLGVLVCALGVSLGLAACGQSNHPPTSENNGVYITAGPITYQLQISRLLNQYTTEDSQYVAGLPAGTSRTLTPTQLWYGVFLWAKNQTDKTQVTSGNFDILDTEGNKYYPIPVNRALNPYGWTSQPLHPGATEPALDTTASFGPTQGGLLLFKLPTTVYDDRPLTLQILSPRGQVWGSISLDL